MTSSVAKHIFIRWYVMSDCLYFHDVDSHWCYCLGNYFIGAYGILVFYFYHFSVFISCNTSLKTNFPSLTIWLAVVKIRSWFLNLSFSKVTNGLFSVLCMHGFKYIWYVSIHFKVSIIIDAQIGPSLVSGRWYLCSLRHNSVVFDDILVFWHSKIF